jgi:tRNA pseudouridine32 synthase/23S rRNA pseudouridine746 synthase
MQTRLYQHTCAVRGEIAVDVLQAASGLPKARIKDAMNKGAAWVKRGSKQTRIRRATANLQSGDTLLLYYNAEILALTPPMPTLVADERQYSVWVKPAGLLAQGTREGDHCSLLRQVELLMKREVYLVHRLDREASGLMLIAHNGKAAAALSALFSREPGKDKALPDLRKTYLAEVTGQPPPQGELASPVEGKPALTRYKRFRHNPETDRSVLEVDLVTGRKHQIRQHLAAAGWPILGDKHYGKGNADSRGLQLYATGLLFTCPLSGRKRDYHYTPGADTTG